MGVEGQEGVALAEGVSADQEVGEDAAWGSDAVFSAASGVRLRTLRIEMDFVASAAARRAEAFG